MGEYLNLVQEVNNSKKKRSERRKINRKSKIKGKGIRPAILAKKREKLMKSYEIQKKEALLKKIMNQESQDFIRHDEYRLTQIRFERNAIDDLADMYSIEPEKVEYAIKVLGSSDNIDLIYSMHIVRKIPFEKAVEKFQRGVNWEDIENYENAKKLSEEYGFKIGPSIKILNSSEYKTIDNILKERKQAKVKTSTARSFPEPEIVFSENDKIIQISNISDEEKRKALIQLLYGEDIVSQEQDDMQSRFEYVIDHYLTQTD